jgi:1-deoxy-D-xylulose-5-phosphate synthase
MSIDKTTFPLLSQIDSPADLRQLDPETLVSLAAEIRGYLLQELNKCGGHFASNLGSVELAIALHYLYDTPHDNVIWDVGHQAYPHKILTGRKERLSTIRQTKGLAPFPSRDESEYDAFTVGHSSTSIGAALGMAIAAALTEQDKRSVAVIGDGAMTAGMAFEALNHAGHARPDMLVILNDNDMSISNNVGALNNYFARIWSSKLYTTFREGSKRVLEKMPNAWGDFMRRTEEHMKGMVAPGTIFEELGFYYVGPIDGHDLPLLLDILKKIRNHKGPRLLHVVTKKGKGYEPAEKDPIKYHAVKPGFLQPEHVAKKTTKKSLTYSNVFGQWLCDIAKQNARVVGITPAMREGSDLIEFSKQFPDRYFDVGIAEQHSVTLAAGMACEGLKPVVAIYSSFLQRAYDQVIHDVALQNLPVLFAIDRASLVGGDGATHNGVFDLSYLRCVPNLVVMAPADENELRHMLTTGIEHTGPSAVRYPRGNVIGVQVDTALTALPIGKAQIRREGQKVALLVFGTLCETALTVAERINATVVNMRFVKPLDSALILQMGTTHELLVTLEENVIMGGAGSGVNEILAANNLHVDTLNLGLPDKFIEHGDHSDLLAAVGLDVTGIQTAIQHHLDDRQLVTRKPQQVKSI